MPLVLVYKATRRRPKRKSPQQLFGERFEPKIQTAYRTGMDDLLTDAQIKRLARSVRDQDVVAAMQQIPSAKDRDSAWDTMRANFETNYKAMLAASGKETIAEMDLGVSFTLNIEDKFLAQWANDKSRQMVEDIESDARDGIKNAIRNGMGSGLTVDQTASVIRPMIGLSERDSTAVQNRLKLHIDNGMDEDLASDMAAEYGEKLKDDRATRIARTESTTAASEGKQASWRQARDDGLTGERPTKKWIGSEFESSPHGACAVCAELDGTSVPLDEDFSTPYGPISGPAAHPNCRCTLAFDPGFGDDASFPDDDDES